MNSQYLVYAPYGIEYVYLPPDFLLFQIMLEKLNVN